MRKLRCDPEYRIIKSERMRKLNNNSEFKAANSQKRRENMRKLRCDPEFQFARTEGMRKLRCDPEYRIINSERMEKLNADPIFQAAHIKRGREIGRIYGKLMADRKANLYWGGERYHSASEAVLTNLFAGDEVNGLEGYLPGWKVEKGKTWQVRDRGLDNGGIDFLIETDEGAKFIEYHPPKTFRNKSGGDLKDGEEYAKFVAIKQRIAEKQGSERAREFVRRVGNIISKKYVESREEDIANSEYAGTPLIYCADIRDVYDKVIVPYSNVKTSYEEFSSQFKRLHKKISDSRKTHKNEEAVVVAA